VTVTEPEVTETLAATVPLPVAGQWATQQCAQGTTDRLVAGKWQLATGRHSKRTLD